MNDPHDAILERYFWTEVDRGIALEDTPLFTGLTNGESLVDVIQREFGLSFPDGESAIEIARKEVEL